jgi:signal transduction histidine kinase
MSSPDKTHFEVFDDIVRLLNDLPEVERAAVFERFREFSHDMRTATGLIDGAQKLLLRELESWEGKEGVQDLFEIIQGNAQRAKEMVEDLRKTVSDGIELPD